MEALTDVFPTSSDELNRGTTQVVSGKPLNRIGWGPDAYLHYSTI